MVYVLDSCAFMNGHKIRYICALLNSKLSVCQLLSNSPKTGTGDVIISVQALEPHRVPPITSENQSLVAQIESLVDQILAQKRDNPRADTRDLERAIDELVYRLYDLAPDEIRLIESKLRIKRQAPNMMVDAILSPRGNKREGAMDLAEPA
jgi:adenine-specific DNA-methyltransferase